MIAGAGTDGDGGEERVVTRSENTGAELAKNHQPSRRGIDAVMAKFRLDALIAPTSGPASLIDLINGDSGGGGRRQRSLGGGRVGGRWRLVVRSC